MGGLVYAVQRLDLPGCVIYSDHSGGQTWEFDLISERAVQYWPARNVIGVLSPDHRFYANVDRDADGSYTLYLRTIRDDPRYSDPISIQGGLGPSLGVMITNNRFVWSANKLAFVWVGVDNKVNLTAARVDGREVKQSRFIAKEETSRLSSIRLLGLSPDGEYLAVDEGRSTRLRGTSYSFWSLNEMALSPTPLDDEPILMGQWSAQGHRFAALTGSNEQANELIMFVPGDDSQTIRVALPQRTYMYVGWSPDGRYLMAASLSTDPDFVRRWRYDIFSADGKLLFGDISGDRIVGAGAGTLLTGLWADQNHLLYLKERPGGGERATDLIMFDVTTGLHRLIGVNIMIPFTNEMFYVSPFQVSSAGAAGNLMVVPQGKRLLIPRWVGNQVTVELASFDGNQRQTLVENADLLLNTQALVIDGLFWSVSGEWVRLLSVTIQNGIPRVRLTVAKADGSMVRTFDDDLDDVVGLKSIYMTGSQAWLGFIGARERERGIEIFNVETGQHQRLVNGLDPREQNWQVIANPSGSHVFVSVANILGREGSRLYLAPVGSDTQVEVTQAMLSTVVWSQDGQHAIYLVRVDEDEFALEMVSRDGMSAGKVVVGERLQPGAVLQSWTACEMETY